MLKYDRTEANGRWPSLLMSLGMPDEFLGKRNGPCPMCGGKDRFRFIDTNGDGTWVCNVCGAGDGLALVQHFRSVDFKAAAKMVAELLPRAVAAPVQQARSPRSRLNTMWRKGRTVTDGDAVSVYLKKRDLWWYAAYSSLRTMQDCEYYEDGKVVSNHPAMLALVRDGNGKPTTLHVTYLTADGTKANVPSPKKIISAMGPGAHVEFGAPSSILHVAEGIETALAVWKKVRADRVYAMLSAGGMKKLVVPEGVKEVWVWGDNDASFTGQEAAYALAFRLKQSKGLEVRVRIPRVVGTDWADKGEE